VQPFKFIVVDSMSLPKCTRSTLFFLFFLQFVGVTLADEQLAPASEAWTSIFDSNDGLKASGLVLAIIALVVGAMLAVLGYQLFHMTVFVIGFIVGGVACALVVERIFQNESWVVAISWVAYIVGGILCGFLAMCLYWPGVFLVGVLAGAMLAVLINTSVAYKIAPNHPGIVLLVFAIVLGIVGILAVKFERPVIILATSFVGAFLIMWGVGFFAGDYPSFNDIGHYRTTDSDGDTSYDLPTAWWTYLAGTIGVFAVAAFIQFRFTAKAHHDRQTHRRRRNRGFPFRSRAVGRQEQYANAGTPESRTRAQRCPGAVV
jgi:hypothetical protein